MAFAKRVLLLLLAAVFQGAVCEYPLLVTSCEELRLAVGAASAPHDGTHPTVIPTHSLSCSNVHVEYPLTLLGGFGASAEPITLSRRTIDHPTLVIDSKDVTLRSIIFKDAGGVGGGAVLLAKNASAVIQSVIFQNSAFGIWPALTIEGKAEVSDTVFEDCHSSGAGGGAVVRACGHARFKDCTFRRNAANMGAGVAVDGLAHFCATTFDANKARHGANVWIRGDDHHAGAKASFCADAAGSGAKAAALFTDKSNAGVESESERGHITKDSCDACGAAFVKSLALFESRRRSRVPILAFLSQANLTDHELGRKAIRPADDEISALDCTAGTFALDGVCEPDCLPQTVTASEDTWRLLDLAGGKHESYVVRFENTCGATLEAVAFDCDGFEGSTWGLERHGRYCVLTGHDDVPAGHTHEFHYTAAGPFTFRPHSAHTHKSSQVKNGRDGIEVVSRVIQTWRRAGSQDLLSRVEVTVNNLSGERVSQVALDCHAFEPEWSIAVERQAGRCLISRPLEHNEPHSFEYITEGVRPVDLSVLEVRGSYGEVVKSAGMLGGMYATVGAVCVLGVVASMSLGWYAFGPNKDRRAAVYGRILTRERTFREARSARSTAEY